MKNRGFRPRFFSSILSNCPPQPGQAPTIPSHLQQRRKTKASPSVTFRNDGSLPPIRQRRHEQFCIIYCIFVRDFLHACVLGSVLSGLREDTGRIDGHSGVRLIHPTGRQTGQTLGYCAPKRTSGRKKRRGPINSPSGTAPERFRFRNNRRSVRNIPPRAIAMQDSRMFGRMPLQAFPSGQPDLQPFRNKTRNGPSAAGIMSRRRNETEKGKRPDRSRKRTALEEYHEYEQKKEPCIAARLLKEAATYSPTCDCSSIGVSGLNFSVRNGKRWDPTAITT